jgi:cytochrome c nitrite reductase small subunit
MWYNYRSQPCEHLCFSTWQIKSPALAQALSGTFFVQSVANNAGPTYPSRRRLFTFFAIFFTVMLGVLAGVGAFTFGYGKGWSYLSNDPVGCANCHVMQGHYDSWLKSSHHHVAVCNDCHLPHDPIGKWLVKGDNGFFHSLAFTLDDFHEPIQAKPRNKRVAQRACFHCHADVVHQMLPVEAGGEMLSCVHCHSDVGHALR